MPPKHGARRTSECMCVPKLRLSPKGKGCWLPGPLQSQSGGVQELWLCGEASILGG